MNGDSLRVHGQPTVNGASSIKPPPPPSESKILKTAGATQAQSLPNAIHAPHINGAVRPLSNGEITPPRNYQEAPEEVLYLVDQEHYLPVSALVGRTAQNCWNDLHELVHQLSTVTIPTQSVDPGRPATALQQSNNQTKSNLDKKDRILNFANKQKATFIKLLVLLQWSKNVHDVSKTISLNFWLHEQRRAYHETCLELFRHKAKATAWQTPNPDIKTAGEILSLGRASSLSNLGYQETWKLTKSQILSTLHRLNHVLTARLAVEEDIPIFMRNYRIHDGRATFTVAQEFEVDLSILEEDNSSPYRTVDVRFLFTPRPNLSAIVRAELERLTDAELASSGLSGCYEFLHDLTLSNQISELHRQAVDLARNQWAGSLHVELLRRNLIIQYWTQRPASKSWIEIGVHSPKSREPSNSDCSIATIDFRWYREGKRVDNFMLTLDASSVSFSTVINQTVSQHISYLLSAIYDKLALNPLFANGVLALDETTSLEAPEEYSLRIEATKDTAITVNVSAVNGLFTVGPASERTNRFQFELNRSKTVIDDFVWKFLNFRCSIAERQVLRSIANTCWQSLPAFKPSIIDVRALLSPTVVRANFFCHPSWSRGYLLAIAYKPAGDTMSILHFGSSTAVLASARTVHTQALQLDGNLSSNFFEDLSEYACGVLVLDSIVQGMKQVSINLEMPFIPDFGSGEDLPTLSFRTDGPDSFTIGSGGTMARLKFLGINTWTHQAAVLVQLKCDASVDVFERLMDSNPDASVEFRPKNRQVALRLTLTIGEIRFSDIVQQVRRLCDVVASLQFLQTMSTVRLLKLSLNTLQLAYQFDSPKEWTMTIELPTQISPPRVRFLPEESNPLACLSTAMSRMLENSQLLLASHLRDMFAIMKLVSPLMQKLWDLQQQTRGANSISAATHKVRIHIVIRQPTMVALQYYSDSMKPTEENNDVITGSRLLARFEILPLTGDKNMFVLRPALEELKSYKRPSYASEVIRDKVKQGIFLSSSGSPGWLCFDSAAAFRADSPDSILDTLHRIMVDCAELPLTQADENNFAAEAKPPQPQASGIPAKAPPQTPLQAQKGAPNGINHPPRPRQPVKAGKVPQSKEVITLDD